MTKSPSRLPADERVSSERRRSRAPLFLAALAGTTAILGAATVATLCRFPELWRAPPRSTAVFRVQSRSMEPAFRGPRFVWRCPECGETFATTLDVDSSGGVRSFDDALPDSPNRSTDANALNADSPEAQKFRATARFFPCPRCGFDRVPAATAVFQDGALVEATDATASRSESTAAQTSSRAAETNANESGTGNSTQTPVPSNVWNDWRARLKRAWNGATPELRPERWEVVVFRAPTGRAMLKRVVGLPGETVELVNGDVFVDGRAATRSLEQIVATATRLDSAQIYRTGGRLTVGATTPIWNDAPTSAPAPQPFAAAASSRSSDPRASTSLSLASPPNNFSKTIFKPSAIFNESPTPSWNGDEVAPVEPVRDFIFDFSWSNDDGTPTRFQLLARRPQRAFLLDFDETAQTIALRSTPLFDGRTRAGRPFDELTDADFVDATVERVPFAASPDDDRAEAAATRFRVFLVDGELTLTKNDAEIARFSTGDGKDSATAAISTPFALLGDVARAFAPALRRDLHYSSVGGAQTTEPRRDVGTPGYFLLGDNSPASLDSRFASFGTIEPNALLFRVETAAPNADF